MYRKSWCSHWWSYLSYRGNSVQLRLCDDQYKVPFSVFLLRVLAQFVSCVLSKTNRWPEAQCWIQWMIYSLTIQGPVSFFSSLVICEPLFTRHEVIRQRACWELVRAALTHSETEVSVPVYRTKPLCNSWQSAERCCLGETPWHVTMVISQINMSAQTFFVFFLFCRGWVHICECSEHLQPVFASRPGHVEASGLCCWSRSRDV